MLEAFLLLATSICFDQRKVELVDRICVHWRARYIAPWTNTNNITCYELNPFDLCSNGQYRVPIASVPDPPPGQVYYFLLTAENEHGRSPTEHE